MGVIKLLTDKIHFSREGEVLQVEAYGEDVIRVRAAVGEIQDENWTLLPAEACRAEIFSLDGGGAILKNGKLQAEITKAGKLTFRNDSGKVLLEEHWTAERDLDARVLRHSPYGLTHIEQRMVAFADEHFYGMGQEAHDLFDLKGATLDLCQQNTKSTIPFVVSSRCYGFLWNNPAIGRVEFGTSGTRWVAESAVQLDYLVIGGDSIAEIERRYCTLTGYAPEFPMWATGMWQSKLRYETQEELLEVAREYKRREIPISMIVCDYFHWPQQGEWKFDKEYWSDPEAMIRELDEMGVKLLVSIWPTVDPRSENFEEMRINNMLIRSEWGPGTLTFCRGPETYYDPMNPEAGEFVWGKVKQNYYDIGVRNFWLDEAEPEIAPYDYENLRYWLGNGMQVSSLYPFYYAKNFYDGQKAAGQKEIVNLIRSAFIGSQRFGVVLWSGDIMADFDSLRRQIKTGLHAAMSGIPWWTTDIGGFHGGDVNSPEYRECFIRWFQFGAFCPVFRMHGFRNRPGRPTTPPYCLDGFCPSGGPNELWSYGEEAYEILKKYVQIRENLRPYIFKHLQKASQDGTPLMRPLFYDFPEEKNYGIFDEYMFGPDLMVCPVYEAGRRERSVYLPQGSAWIDAASGREYEGGSTISVEAPLVRIPLFLRKGGTITEDMLR